MNKIIPWRESSKIITKREHLKEMTQIKRITLNKNNIENFISARKDLVKAYKLYIDYI